VHQVGDQPRLHYDAARSTNPQDVHTASGIVKPTLLPAAIVDELELIRESNRQQYWFDNT